MNKPIDPYRDNNDFDNWARRNGIDPERARRLAKEVGSSIRDEDYVEDEEPTNL